MSFYHNNAYGVNNLINNLNSNTVTFTASSDGTSHIPFLGLTGLNLSSALYEIQYQNLPLDNTNFTVGVDNISINLSDGWTIGIGEKVKLICYTLN